MIKEPLKVQISTFGCQMNTYDTEVAGGLLEKDGFTLIQDEGEPGPGKHRIPVADVVLMNTCSVRDHAEQRVFGRLGWLGKVKQKRPELIVGLMGCMVEEHKENLFRRFPQLDLMVGTRNIRDLPGLVREVKKTRQQVSKIRQEGISIEYTEQIKREGKYHAWLPIMTGCNKVCTYCIVPITRGSEVSMSAREVYREADRLAADGVKWLTLLGQNVNSYRGEAEGEEPILFPKLLERLCEIEGLELIGFTTSHPQDATEELFQVLKNNPKISRRFHLPMQSGSDRMLKRMKRLHTYDEFKTKVDRLRELAPDVALTTDLITGFAGETEEDHQATLQAMKEIRFESAFIYKYSLRPGTPAAKLKDDVAEDVKARRHKELLDLQRQINEEENRKYLGKVFSVFAETEGTRNEGCLIGRTAHDKRVVFSGKPAQIGTSVSVQLNELKFETFLGAPVCE